MQSQSGQLRNSDTEHADKPGTAGGNKSGLVLEDFLRETGGSCGDSFGYLPLTLASKK